MALAMSKTVEPLLPTWHGTMCSIVAPVEILPIMCNFIANKIENPGILEASLGSDFYSSPLLVSVARAVPLEASF